MPDDTRFLDPDTTPSYPALGTKVEKLRKAARSDAAKRREHGEAVLEAVRSKQTQALRRDLGSFRSNCASGTEHTDGKSILSAVAQQNKRAFWAAVERDKKARTDDEIRRAYAEAMKAKQAANDL